MLDVTKAKVLHQWAYESPLISCRISPTGSEAVSTSEDAKLVRWIIPSGEKLPLEGHESWVHALVYNQSGTVLVSGGCDGRLIWWDMTSSPPAIVRKLDAHQGWVRAIAISMDGKRLVSVGNDRAIRFWDFDTGAPVSQIENAHERHIYSVAFHPDEPILLTGDLLGKVHVWQLEDNAKLRTMEATALYTENKGQLAEFGGVRTLSMNAARKEVIAGGTHKATNPFGAVHEPLMLRLGWEDGVLRKSHQCDGIPGGLLYRVQWLPDGNTIAVSGGSTGGFLLFFNDSQEKEYHRFRLPSLARDMDLHPASGLIATAHYDRHLRITTVA
jgi:WD40 repeat protein